MKKARYIFRGFKKEEKSKQKDTEWTLHLNQDNSSVKSEDSTPKMIENTW